MLNVVTHNPLRRGEIPHRHFDDPALYVGKLTAAPEFDILLHGDVLGFPVVVLHGLVEIIRPLVFQGQDVEEHRVFAVDDFLGGKSLFGFGLVQHECAVSDFVGFVHG